MRKYLNTELVREEFSDFTVEQLEERLASVLGKFVMAQAKGADDSEAMLDMANMLVEMAVLNEVAEGIAGD